MPSTFEESVRITVKLEEKGGLPALYTAQNFHASEDVFHLDWLI